MGTGKREEGSLGCNYRDMTKKGWRQTPHGGEAPKKKDKGGDLKLRA